MTQGPSLQGQIVINTKSVESAINSIKKLQVNVGKAFGGGTQQATRFAKALDKQSQVYTKVAGDSRKYANVVAKAANSIATYEAAVKKSNIADSKKAALVKAATSQLKGFETAVKAGASSGQALKNVTTQLNVSMGQLRRDLSAATSAEQEKIKSAQNLQKSQIQMDKTLSSVTQQYRAATAAVKDSGLAETEKAGLLKKLDTEHKKLNATLRNTSTTTRQASAAQNKYKEALQKVRLASKSGQLKSYKDEMRNLSTSVQVALGPLSGIASRLTALTTLFNRNAASVAALIATFTAFTVLFTKSAQVAEEAEKQMFRINAQLEQMGGTAQVTGDEINAMSHKIAAGTLLSAKEVRDASGALIEFSGVAREQFGSVIKTAQGMSAVFGGNLKSNIRKLGRAIEDPIGGMSRLEQTGVILSESTREQIETLVAQGEAYKATSILLEETASLQKAAGAEALGLAGAYDTVSGNLDKMYEELFITSGAAKALAQSVMDVADSIAEFANSDQAKVLGQMFKTMAGTIGTAFKFALDNVGLLAVALTGIMGSVIPKAIVAILTLAKSFKTKLFTSITATKVAMQGFTTSTKKATVVASIFNSTLNKNPLVAVVSGVVALSAAIWGYHSAMSAVNKLGQGLNEKILSQIEAEIIKRDDLSKKQAQDFRDRASLIASETAEYEKAMEERIDLTEQLEAAAMKAMDWDGMIGGGTSENLLKNVEGIKILLSREITPAQKKVLENLLSAQQAAEKVETALAGVKTEARELHDEVRKTKAQLSEMEDVKKLEGALDRLTRLSKEFLPDLSKMETLQKELDTARETAGALAELGYMSEEARVGYKKIEKVIVAIKKEMRELAEEDGLSKEATTLVEAMRAARTEARLLREQVGKTDEEKAIIKLNAEMDELTHKTKALVAELSIKERAGLASLLPGVEEAAGVDAVTAAYVRWVKAQKEAGLSAEKEQAALDTVKEFREGQRSDLQKLVADYNKVAEAARLAGDEEALAAAKKQLGKDKDAVDRTAKEVATTPFSDLDRITEEYEARKALLEGQYANEEENYIKHLDKMKEDAEQRKVFMDFATGAEQASDIVGQAMSAMTAAGQENNDAYRAMAMGQAIINAALAVSQVLADETLGTYQKIGMSALIGATAGAQVAAIQAQSMATGGRVQGPGTSTSDSIPANLSNGEYVVKAEAARKIGMRNLDMMNNGQMPSFNSGGSVGMPAGAMGGNGGDASVNFTIIDQSTGKKEFTQEESTDADGKRQIKLMIKDTVKEVIATGGADREFASSYGIKRQGRRV